MGTANNWGYEQVQDKIEDLDNRLNDLMKSSELMIKTITQLNQSVIELKNLQDKFTKWLLVVVCVIALGKGLLELINEMFFVEKTHILEKSGPV